MSTSSSRHKPGNSVSRPLVSVVVLNWNGKRFIDPFMKSFLQQTYPQDRLELLFTDNGSIDDSVAYFNEHYGHDARLKVVLNGKNYGYAGGNDLGMKQASGEYVLVCNNDLELDKQAIKELVAAAQKHEADVVAAKLMYLNRPGIINNAGSKLDPRSDWPIKEIGINEKDHGQYDKDAEISAFCGACILLRRDFLQTVGLFDKTFFLYFEDGDLSWRGQKAGKHFFLAPKAVAYHVHTGSSKEGSPTFNHFVGRNRILILAKNAPFGVFLKGFAKTLRDHCLLRIKNLWAALNGRYSKKQAWREFYLSQKMLLATVGLLPYAWCKRFGIIKEDTL
jgi:GT2 family glycosyltransferase